MAPLRSAHAAGLELDERDECGVTVIAARGELDLATAPELCHALLRCTGPAAAPIVALDLRAIAFCDSTGARALMGAVSEIETRSGRVAIILTEGGDLDRTLTLAGAREFLHVTSTPAGARQLLAADDCQGASAGC
jgi:anti-sigma B factor antagonist